MLDDGSIVTVFAPQEIMNHREIAAAVLGIKADIDTETAGKLLIKRDYILSEAQGRETERKMGTKILPEGGNSVFFVKTAHPNDPVMASFGGFLSGYYCFLGDDVRCRIDDRIFIRNLNISRFE